jgi:hypothetical protein
MSSTLALRPTVSLAASLLVCACVHKEDLSDPEALASASGEESSSTTSTDDGASSVSATSTTGEGACASNDGTRTSLQIYSGPDEDPALFGIEDIAITSGGEVGLAFIQGNHLWAFVDAGGSIAFDDAPGDLAHVGLVRALQGGGWAVANSWLLDPDDWVQVVAADGSIAYNGEWVVDTQQNYIIDQLVAFTDGSTLAQISWYDVDSHHQGRLAHYDAGGTLMETIDVTDATRGAMVPTDDGTVWALRVVGNDTEILRYAPGGYADAAQTMLASDRWGQRLAVDSEGRPAFTSIDAVRNTNDPVPLYHLDVFDPATGDIAEAYDSDVTVGLGYPADVAGGPCGELFASGFNENGGYVGRLGDDGFAWIDTPSVEGGARLRVIDDGTLVAVGQTSLEQPQNLGPWVARYEP